MPFEEGTPYDFAAQLDLGNHFSHREPAWSPNGEYLAFTSDNMTQADIMLANLVTLEVTNLTEQLGGLFYRPIWSTDSNYLAFTSLDWDDPGLWVVSLEHARVRQLTKLGVSNYAWSTRENVLTAYLGGTEHRISTVPLNGPVVKSEDIVFDADAPPHINALSPPVWSNTGRYVALEGFDFRSDIWVADTTSQTTVNITNTWEFNEMEPTWSPNDTRLAFSSNRGGDDYHIWMVDVDGGNPGNLTGSNQE